MSHPFFAAPPPKSLDRNAFCRRRRSQHLSIEDGAATLTAFTAAAIAAARANMPEQPGTWVICGGGRKNKTLMAMIAGRVENAVVPAEAAGFRRRRRGGGGVGLHGRALAAGLAHHVSRHDRRAQAHDRR